MVPSPDSDESDCHSNKKRRLDNGSSKITCKIEESLAAEEEECSKLLDSPEDVVQGKYFSTPPGQLWNM